MDYGTNVADFRAEDRVELHPACDLWMMGARFGDVVSTGRKYVHVKLDRVASVKRFLPWQVRLVEPRREWAEPRGTFEGNDCA